MRGESVREGEANVPLSQAEVEEIQRKHSHDVIYQTSRPGATATRGSGV
jgi:hypothetical protein